MEHLEFSLDENGIGALLFSREKVLNALNEALIREAIGCLEELAGREDLKVLILSGKGPKSFVAGADISELESADVQKGEEISRLGHTLMNAIAAFPRPVIAAINGFALGGGLEVALACDLRYASSKARMGLPEVTLGLIPGYGGTQRLVQAVGQARALEYIYTGDMVDASTALSHGLVQGVFEAETFLEEVHKVALKIASRAPLALQAAKRAAQSLEAEDLEQGLKTEISEFARICGTEDKNEGTAAFLQKRVAAFAGK